MALWWLVLSHNHIFFPHLHPAKCTAPHKTRLPQDPFWNLFWLATKRNFALLLSLFIYSFHKSLLNTYCVPRNMLDSGSQRWNWWAGPCPDTIYSPVGGDSIRKRTITKTCGDVWIVLRCTGYAKQGHLIQSEESGKLCWRVGYLSWVLSQGKVWRCGCKSKKIK